MTEHYMNPRAPTGRKYPLDKMEVGDFFRFAPHYSQLVNMAVYYDARRNGRKFKSVKDLDGKMTCLRIS